MSGSRFFTALLFIFLLVPSTRANAGEEQGSFLDRTGIDIHGFLDLRGGSRIREDDYQRDTSLLESRLQLDMSRAGDSFTLQVRADFIYDDVQEDTDLDLEEGTGYLDLREANLLFSPLDLIDVKIGRQILTWGTGDLLFLNDLFPKDWQSFFIGRDEEYLKAPSDALLISLFPDFANIDLVYMPRFDADRFISGERISYYHTTLGRLAGRDAIIDPLTPNDWLDDDEISLRISKNIKGYELAFYGYHGFWKSPIGMDLIQQKAFFPNLNVYGASLRGSLIKGLFHLEASYYDSKDDTSGDNPYIPNSEIRILAGYEQELAKEFSAAVQYYLESMRHYETYQATLPPSVHPKDEERHLFTVRLTKLALNQNLTLSLFCFYSPSDQDAYFRPTVKYKISDSLMITLGGNIFTGDADYTFFGQFEKNSNIYAGIRYSF
ncbi:MAG: hypothetical protein V2J25_17995 [Desulfatiglans sp.]|jgi:hypothetical protein|nr:hypothetical protein [Thermodesulfobacteriota bacterium]MEE4354754.1 hypothetical protein [Desulfatiglans sp.]